MRGAYLGVHVRHESGADLAGLSLADIHLLDVQLVRLLVLIRLDHLADAHVDELLDALGGLGGLVGHRANGDARGPIDEKLPFFRGGEFVETNVSWRRFPSRRT